MRVFNGNRIRLQVNDQIHGGDGGVDDGEHHVKRNVDDEKSVQDIEPEVDPDRVKQVIAAFHDHVHDDNQRRQDHNVGEDVRYQLETGKIGVNKPEYGVPERPDHAEQHRTADKPVAGVEFHAQVAAPARLFAGRPGEEREHYLEL
jgi:hypothetical protein